MLVVVSGTTCPSLGYAVDLSPSLAYAVGLSFSNVSVTHFDSDDIRPVRSIATALLTFGEMMHCDFAFRWCGYKNLMMRTTMMMTMMTMIMMTRVMMIMMITMADWSLVQLAWTGWFSGHYWVLHLRNYSRMYTSNGAYLLFSIFWRSYLKMWRSGSHIEQEPVGMIKTLIQLE